MHDLFITWKRLPDIICLSKIRLKQEPLININLQGYNFVHMNSKSQAGGVAMDISNKNRYMKLIMI